jgi:hypothetical protein
MSRNARASTTWPLAAGESRVLKVAARTRCIAARGILRVIEPPNWLGERVVGRAVALQEGESHVVESAGWVTVHALSDSTLLCQTPASRMGALMSSMVSSLVSSLWTRRPRPGRALRVSATSL